MRKLYKALALVLAMAMLLALGAFAEGEKYDAETIRVGVASLPANMDPAISVGNATIRLHYNIYETLIYADQDNGYALSPMLAKSWERVDDTTLRVYLRDDVTWHNGDHFTSKDVKFSFERLQNPDIDGLSLARSLMSTIDHVDIIDDYTCDIVTISADPLLETRLASNWGAWILPCDYMSSISADEFTLAPVGSGPYKVVSVSPEKVVMERFDGYWGEAAHIQNLEYVLYSEVSTRITALLTGECDVITQVPADQVATVDASSGVKAVTLPIENLHVIQFWIKGEDDGTNIINNKTFRQALSYAVDRQLLSDALWGGAAVVPQGHQYVSYGEQYFSDYPVEEYNLDKAKELLAESGYAGEEIVYELKSGYYTFGNEVAEAVVDMWKGIGVNARVEFKDSDDEATQVRNWSNSMRFPDHAGGLWLLWGSKTEKDWATMPQEFKDAGAILTSSMDQEERMAAARKLMDIFREEVPAILLYAPVENWGVRDGIEWHPYSSQTLNFRAEGFWLTEPEK